MLISKHQHYIELLSIVINAETPFLTIRKHVARNLKTLDKIVYLELNVSSWSTNLYRTHFEARPMVGDEWICNCSKDLKLQHWVYIQRPINENSTSTSKIENISTNI